nr:putative reverse transcriptase domain-containing protein [Tanacetum cinerariifolium]
KRGKLNPRYVGPFKVLEGIGDVAYKLNLPEELSRVHNAFHVSNLKKCHADEPLAVPLDGLHFDDKLHFVKEPVEIVDREVKRLKRSRIPLVKPVGHRPAAATEKFFGGPFFDETKNAPRGPIYSIQYVTLHHSPFSTPPPSRRLPLRPYLGNAPPQPHPPHHASPPPCHPTVTAAAAHPLHHYHRAPPHCFQQHHRNTTSTIATKATKGVFVCGGQQPRGGGFPIFGRVCLGGSHRQRVFVWVAATASGCLFGAAETTRVVCFVGIRCNSLVELYQSSFCLALKMCVPTIVLHNR